MKSNQKMKSILLAGTALLWVCTAIAQPDWEVNPPDFQYTMTVTGSGFYGCGITTNTDNRVAAFINGEVRGVANFDTEVNGQFLAYLVIYDNDPGGSEVEFKLYNAATGEVTAALEGLTFLDGQIIGNSTNPFRFRDHFALSGIYLTSDTLMDFYEQGTEIGEIFIRNENGDTLSGNFQFIDDAAGADNAHFSILTSFLILETPIQFADKDTFLIHLQGSTEAGCTLETAFVLSVFNTNVPPTGLQSDTVSISENKPPGSLVAVLEALDQTPNDSHSFTFYAPLGLSADQSAFEIDGQELYTIIKLDYEVQHRYYLPIRITDLAGYTAVDTLVVQVIDESETEPDEGSQSVSLETSNLLTPNQDGYNDTFQIPNIGRYAGYELLIYNAVGNLLYDTTHYDNTWTGTTSNGKELPTGTYYYIFQGVNNSSNRFMGEINIYRENKF